jgi:hypothetical protein
MHCEDVYCSKYSVLDSSRSWISIRNTECIPEYRELL